MRPGLSLAALLLCLVPVLGCAEGALVKNAQGNERYRAGEYQEALALFREAQVERPDLPELGYNAAAALFQLKEYPRALRELQLSLGADEEELKARGYYNLGNTLFRLERLEEAKEAYQESLKAEPRDREAKFNLEYVNRLLEQAAQAQPRPAPGPQGETGEGEESQQPSRGQPGGAPGEEPGRPGAGSPFGPGQPDPRLERELKEALQALGEEVTIEEALRVLDALRDQQKGIEALLYPGRPPERRGVRDW